MSQRDPGFERFSRELDADWLRQRLRTTASPSHDGIDEASLLRELEAADPLGASPRRSVIAGLREMLAFWPGRLVLAAAAVLLLVIGSQLGRMVQDRPGPRVAAIPARPIYIPDDGGDRTLGIAGSVKPASRAKFREAMSFYSSADFPEKALPLLQEAVVADPVNDEAQFWLGVVLLLKKRGGDAISPLEEAARLAPRQSLYKQYLLFAYLQTGAVDKATALQADLLEQQPRR